MEEIKKRQQEEEEEENDDTNEVATKKPRVSEVTDDGDDMGEDIMAWLSVDDETVGELMKLLETTETTTSNTATTTTTTTTRVKFINNPYSSSLIFQSSSSNYITINGNEETCGSSFSDTESSLMVSVDMSGIVNFVGLQNGGAWGSNEVEARGWMVMEEVEEGEGDGGGGCIGMDGCDGFDWDWDDDTLARFLGEDFC